MSTNHLAHFLLFQLPKPTLLSSSTREFWSCVVSISSSAHGTGPVRFDDCNFELPSLYDPWTVYGQSKTGNIYLASEIERRYGSRGLHATTVHPGNVRSDLRSHLTDDSGAWDTPYGRAREKSQAQGAATRVFAALSRDWEGKGRVHLSGCRVMGPFKGNEAMDVSDDGYAPWVYDAVSE